MNKPSIIAALKLGVPVYLRLSKGIARITLNRFNKFGCIRHVEANHALYATRWLTHKQVEYFINTKPFNFSTDAESLKERETPYKHDNEPSHSEQS
jgi:hypothetical protein